jgi:hypothetical protein
LWYIFQPAVQKRSTLLKHFAASRIVCYNSPYWRGAGVVELACLENK